MGIFIDMKILPLYEDMNIHKDIDEERIRFSIPNIGRIILVQTYPRYEFWDELDEAEQMALKIDENDVIGKIEHLEVSERYMRKGYGRMLMVNAINEAKSQDWMPLYLNASPIGMRGLNLNNLTRFYETFGFKVFKHEGNNNLMMLWA